MRTCPKCCDYYADEQPGFCLVDGMPLVTVDPLSERWSEGARVIDEKESALRSLHRKLKWRRYVLRAMTMLMATLVVFVLVMNGLIYLKPKQGGATPVAQPTVTPGPEASPILVAVSEPSPTPFATPSAEPSATQTPAPTPTPSPPPTPQVCSDKDKQLEMAAIKRSYGGTWQRNIESERPEIKAANVPAGYENLEPVLSPLKYSSTFSKTCMTGVVMVRYTWYINMSVYGMLQVKPIDREKKFACEKRGGKWLCR